MVVHIETKKVKDDDDDHEEPFEPLVIIEFSPKTDAAAKEWLTAKLQAPKTSGGAELTVRTHTKPNKKVLV